MAEKVGQGYRERVTFSDHAWLRLQRVSRELGVNERTLIEVLVATGLAQWEALYISPGQHTDAAAVEAGMTASAESMLAGAVSPARPGVSGAGRSGPLERRQFAPVRR